MSRVPAIRESVPNLLRMIRHFWPYARKQRKLIGGAFVALISGVALRALEPWPLKIIFDDVLVGSGEGPLGDNRVIVLLAAAGSLVAILALRAATTYWQKVGFALIGNRVLTEVRGDLYRHLQCLSLSFHNRSRRGDLVVRITGDIGRLKEVTTTALMPLAASVLVIVIMSGLMLWVNWSLALVVIATLPLYALPTKRIARRIQVASRDQRRREGAIAATASESIHAIKVVKALSLEEEFSRAFAGQNKKSLKDGVKIRRLAARMQGSVQILTGVSTALVLIWGGILVLRGSLTPGELLVFLAYLKTMCKPMQDFAKYSSRIAKASSAGERVLELFSESPDVFDRPDATDAPPLRGDIEFRDVSFSYGDGGEHLSDINLRIRPGERVAIVGASGHGKSTLVSLIPRLYDPTDGVIRLDGNDVRSYTLSSIRKQISIVLQDTTLFAGTVAENIAFGTRDSSDAEIRAAARSAYASEFVERLPEGYETYLGEGGVNLSAGQRQRIALARAALRMTPIIILDEPTTGLDEEAQHEVVGALESVCQGRTVLLVTHDLNLAARSDRIVLIEHGRIREVGSHDELIEFGGGYSRVFRLQSDWSRAQSEPQAAPARQSA